MTLTLYSIATTIILFVYHYCLIGVLKLRLRYLVCHHSDQVIFTTKVDLNLKITSGYVTIVTICINRTIVTILQKFPCRLPLWFICLRQQSQGNTTDVLVLFKST